MKFLGLLCYSFLGLISISQAQLCNGSLGDPIVNITFGTAHIILPKTVTTYDYVRGCPLKGQYTIQNLIFGCGETPSAHSWHLLAGDHTRDLNGQFMLVNAESTPGIIHLDTAEVCGNTNYQYAAWIANVMEKNLACGGHPILPNVTFTVSTLSGQLLATSNSGDLPLEDSKVWKQFGLTFTTPPNVSTVILSLSTNPKTGCGSAFAVDDITFSICGPSVSATIDGSKDPANVCADYTNPFILKGSYSAGFNAPAVQWQNSLDTGKTWIDITGETTLSYHVPHRTTGVILYRIAVAESPNINSLHCRVVSNSIYTEIHPVPLHQAPENILGCKDKNLVLPQADPSALEVEWTGPNGYYSTDPKSIVPAINYADTGIYRLKQTFYFGCISIDTFNLQVFPSTTISTQTFYSICEGNTIKLSATGQGTFKWTPPDGLSNDSIANPVVSPADSIIYKVVLTNSFGCKDSADVIINVFKNPYVNAGPDKEIMTGDSIMLNGTATGTKINYFWSPSDYISNSNILNPISFPPQDKQYTLTAISNVGCGMATSRVNIIVFKDIFIPNAFTPNDDGINDNFKIIAADSYKVLKLLVYNRWGELVFQETNIHHGWDGKFKGIPQPAGTYIYYFEMESPAHKILSRKGAVLLLR